MTATFIIIYIVIALILIGLINIFFLKSKKKSKDKQVEQRSTKDSKRQCYQSKFKASDLENIEDDKRKHKFDSTQHETPISSKTMDSDSKYENQHNYLIRSKQDDDKEDKQGHHQEGHYNTEINDVLNPIDPNSTEGKVNKKIKNQESNFIFGKGITRGKILAAMLFGMFIAILNQTLLNVALPKINTEFNITASTGQWLMTGFMLVNGILIPISAFLFNKYSYRKLFIVGLVLFTMGSLVCAISINFPVMMSGRVLQAIGAGILMPLGSNVIVTIFPPEKRGVAMGTMGIAMILAPAIGPTLSGYIVQNYHWNVMFYGMFFIGLVAIVIGLFWFKLYQSTTNPKADIPGIIFSTIGFGALLYGFSEAGNKGWGSTEIVSMFVIGTIFIILFVLCLVSMFVTVITVILNRTVLKVLNILILASMLFITLYFSYIIHTIAQKISESLKQYYLTVSPNQVITEADAIHNALILLACSIALIIISLFFRNRLARIR